MEEDSEKNQKLGPVMSGPVTHMLTVSHQKSRIFFPPIPGSKAFGTPLRRLYRPVSSFWEGRRKNSWTQMQLLTILKTFQVVYYSI